ncbi:MAG: hypothetical protein ACK5IJ_05550 [Mangrovibacterium sp.]
MDKEFEKWLKQNELFEYYKSNPQQQVEIYEDYQSEREGIDPKDVDDWVIWLCNNPELAEEHYPLLVSRLKERLRKTPPFKTANIIQSLPELCEDLKKDINALDGEYRKKRIQEQINFLNEILGECEYSTDIENQAIESVRPYLFDLLNYWKSELKQKPELNKASILFKSPQIIESLYDELKGYFQGKEAELKKALQGEPLREMLLFPHNQNKLVEVFKRLKYNGFLLSAPTEIKSWICSTFTFQSQKGDKKEVRNLNPSTVHDILTKDKCEPPKKERICVVGWLPYKSPSTRKSEADKENH